MNDPPHDDPREHQHGERVEVVRPREVVRFWNRAEVASEQERARDRHALVAPGELVELQEEGVEDHPEREREHAEVDLHVADAQRGHGHRDDRGGHRCREEDDLEGADLEPAGEERRGVRAEPDEERVAERDEARVTEHQVQAEQHDAVGHEGQHEEDVVDGGDPRHRDDGAERERNGQHRAHAAAPPKRPRGRMTRTLMTIR